MKLFLVLCLCYFLIKRETTSRNITSIDLFIHTLHNDGMLKT